jgi:hypothetical protein
MRSATSSVRRSALSSARTELSLSRAFIRRGTFFIATSLIALFPATGVSFYEGILHVAAPTRIENALVNYIVLICSFLFEGCHGGSR